MHSWHLAAFFNILSLPLKVVYVKTRYTLYIQYHWHSAYICSATIFVFHCDSISRSLIKLVCAVLSRFQMHRCVLCIWRLVLSHRWRRSWVLSEDAIVGQCFAHLHFSLLKLKRWLAGILHMPPSVRSTLVQLCVKTGNGKILFKEAMIDQEFRWMLTC